MTTPAGTEAPAPPVRPPTGALSSRELALMGGVAALWGSVYLFTKVIVEDIGVLSAVFLRLALAAAGLLAFARIGRLTWDDFRPATPGLQRLPAGWVTYVILALFDSAAPFLLISWGEDRIPSGTAGILIATSPLFAAVLAPWWPARGHEGLGRVQFLGLLVGFGGAVLLVFGRTRVEGIGGGEALLGELAILGGALCFAMAALYTRYAFSGRKSLVPATGATTVSALFWTVPWIAAGVPGHAPEWETVFATLMLGLGGTAVAYVLYFELIRSVGGPRALMVTYLASGASLFYGAVFLDETVTVAAVGGLALIVAGVAVSSRARRGSP
jgi:drug/metabolite transporter (DMT)-like permease